MESCILDNLDIVVSYLISHISQPNLTSNPLDYRKTSVPKFKTPLQKELLQVGEVLFLLTGDTSCHIQGLSSAVYAIVSMQHGELSCLLIVNGYCHLVR